MFLTRVLFIQNDPLSPGIQLKNRCYIWDKLSMKDREPLKEDSFYDEANAEKNVENDFYEGLARKKRTQMDDPNNSMIVLRYEQESKDLALIRHIK